MGDGMGCVRDPPRNMLLHIYYHTKFGHCSVGQTVWAEVGSQKFGRHWGPTPLDGGRGDPQKHASPSCITMPILVILGQTI